MARFVERDKLRNKFLRGAPSGVSRVTIPTPDGEHLDAVQFAVAGPAAPWIVWFNANGVIYEQNLGFMLDYTQAVGANGLVFNYRGVGDSSGWPRLARE